MLTMMMIGNKIAQARKNLNLSQTQLAQQLSISPQAVGKWERGESMPDIITFNRLAEVLKVDMNYFSESFQSAPIGSMDEEPAETAAGNSPDEPVRNTTWDMSSGDWRDADFSGLKNISEKFKYSNIQNCKFTGSDLSYLHLKSNQVNGCDFSHSNLSNSHFGGSNIVNSIFSECSLKNSVFSGSAIKGCNFTEADFSGMAVKSCSLQKNITAGAIWNHTAFHSTQLADMVLEGTFEECSFVNCDLTKAVFQDAMLINTFFKNSKLKKTQFINCKADNITYAFLKSNKADMTGIELLA